MDITLTANEADLAVTDRQQQQDRSALRAAMNLFFISVEKKAFGMARMATRDYDEALEIVQEAMFRMVDKYSHKPENQWAPLFYRILHNLINDWHRRRKRVIPFSLFSKKEEADDPMEYLDEVTEWFPEKDIDIERDTARFLDFFQELPARQQQAFLLRCWEGLSVADTATAMECSEGSVKTHYSRARENLRKRLLEANNE